MLRCFVLSLLLVLLPIQTAWAAAAVYCSHHGEDEAVQHFGHHGGGHHSGNHDGHEEGHDALTDVGNDGDQPDLQKAAEPSHGHHHLGGTLGMLGSFFLAIPITTSPGAYTELAARISSPPPSQPERPNWRTAT